MTGMTTSAEVRECETTSAGVRECGSAGGSVGLARVATIVVVAGVFFLGACAPDDGRTPLIVYSPHGPDMLEAFELRFEALHPTVDVQWLDMGSQEVLDRLRSEQANPQADIWWGAPAPLFQTAAEAGLLEPYAPSWAGEVTEYADSLHRYHG
ncbi:MAG TPA: hypothetical protein VFI91_06125, partial [Longimicrobiaceae bacterium]|nr:hypothetical protein [Longimicrobiaceae bacterium]